MLILNFSPFPELKTDRLILRRLTIKDENGRYFSANTPTSELVYNKEPILNFKGREIGFQIIDKVEIKTYETYTNPQITEEICKKLSFALTKAAFTTSRISSGNSITGHSTPPKSDKISM